MKHGTQTNSSNVTNTCSRKVWERTESKKKKKKKGKVRRKVESHQKADPPGASSCQGYWSQKAGRLDRIFSTLCHVSILDIFNFSKKKKKLHKCPFLLIIFCLFFTPRFLNPSCAMGAQQNLCSPSKKKN